MAEPVETKASRRGFLKVVTAAIGGLVGAVLAVPIIEAVIFPTRRRVVTGAGEPVRVAAASAVTTTPTRVEITVAEQRDAWAKTSNVRLGAAWLVRDATGKVCAFSTTCPHLGCAVDYEAEADHFRCPCHTSSFDKAGQRLSGPAKRGMDPLEATVDADGNVLVRFARFKLDTPDREEG